MGRRTGILESGRVLYLPLGSIRPNPAQPRRVFDPAGLQELADSIREYGILQPLTVRRRENGYELIAGERRLRAEVEHGEHRQGDDDAPRWFYPAKRSGDQHPEDEGE